MPAPAAQEGERTRYRAKLVKPQVVGKRVDIDRFSGSALDSDWSWAEGRVGYVAKGVALVVLGALFVLAAVRSDPQEAGGLDQALRTIGEQPFGQVLLVAVGAGFVAFGIFCGVRARYARN